jgi:hypothetical protein
MAEEKHTEEKREKKDIWDILKALGPAILAAVVAVMGGWYNLQQTQLNKASEMQQARLNKDSQMQQVYTNIMTERESSDNTIRAKMFEILIGSMFEKGAGSAATNPNDVTTIQKQVMFLDLLSRNFDTIDVKPLFENLDQNLTKKIYDEKDYSAAQRGDFFDTRSELRQVGRLLSVKQLNALASLPGSVVQGIVLLKDKDGNIQAIKDESVSNGNGVKIPVDIKCNEIYDGTVDISLDYTKSKSSDQSFKAPAFGVSFYDLPYIDNSVLDLDMRVGVILTKSVSIRDFDMFSDRLDKKLIKDYQDLKDGGITQYAELRIIKFPAKYIGNRDRPYLQEIIQELIGGQKEETAAK